MSSVRICKRSPKACIACRRKKVKCPAERPSCSTCRRLNQICRYMNETSKDATPADRFNVANIFNDAQSTHETPLRSSIARSAEHEITSCLAMQLSNHIPHERFLNRAVSVYFQYSHRQPIWLFLDEMSLAKKASNEVLLMICVFAICYDPNLSSADDLEPPQFYTGLVRTSIMMRVARGEVVLDTLQCLCLLSYYNYAADDLHLARLHLGLARDLLCQSGLDSRSFSSPPDSEDVKKLTWSIYILEQTYALPTRALAITETFQSEYIYLQNTVGSPATNGSNVPPECMSDNSSAAVGMWTCMLQTLGLWKQVRDYVAECAEGRNDSPWISSSTFLRICSQLNEVECTLPSRYRYKNANFADRSKQEVDQDRLFWYAWINMQLTYHAIHAVLNHPFLYAQKASKHKRGPNMFWRNSSELALLHSVWITRVTRMLLEQNLIIYDPHFSQLIAIAATLHLYHSYAADETIRDAALLHLDTCVAYVRDNGQIWPSCRQLSEDLDRLIDQSSWHAQDGKRRKLSLNTSVMWAILGYNPPAGYRSTSGLFHSSLPRQFIMSDDGQTDLGRVSHNKQAIEICRPDRNEATSPSWDQESVIHDRVGPVNGAGRLEVDQGTQQDDVLLSWTNDHHTLMEADYGDFFGMFDFDGVNAGNLSMGTL